MTSAATVGTGPHTVNELGRIASTQDTISLSWTTTVWAWVSDYIHYFTRNINTHKGTNE